MKKLDIILTAVFLVILIAALWVGIDMLLDVVRGR